MEGLAFVPQEVVLQKSSELLKVRLDRQGQREKRRGRILGPASSVLMFNHVTDSTALLFTPLTHFLSFSIRCGFCFLVQRYPPSLAGSQDVVDLYNEVLEDLREEFGNSTIAQYETQIIVSRALAFFISPPLLGYKRRTLGVFFFLFFISD